MTALLITTIILLVLAIGIAAGYYARSIHDKLAGIYALYKDRLETPAGVVRPERTPAMRNTRAQPIDLGIGDEAGIVRRPSPEEIMVQNSKERAARLRD